MRRCRLSSSVTLVGLLVIAGLLSAGTVITPPSGGGAVSLGTVTGTLGVANGGTGTTTAFTAGSVLFAGASGVYSQDNTKLFFDDSNNRLGIGTASPANALHVVTTGANTILEGTSGGAELALRSSQSPADANIAGRLMWQAYDSGSTQTTFAELRAIADTVLDGGTEAGSLHFYTRVAGSTAARWKITTGHWLAVTDNTYDIGASGATRPRTGYFGTSIVLPNGTVSAPSLVFGGSAAFYAASATITVAESSTNRFTFAPQAAAPGMVAANDMAYGWSSTTSSAASLDTGLRRNAAGVVEINNGTAAAYRDLKLRAIESTGYAFASLPAANNGTHVFCTDCSPATSPCTGSGAGAHAFRQGGAWKCL
jgi:hypothetical protein